MNKITIIVSMYLSENFQKYINILEQFLEIGCRISIIDTGVQNNKDCVNIAGLSYYYCKDDAEKITAYNTILNKNAPTNNDVLLIDESILYSIQDCNSLINEMNNVLYFTEKHGFVSPRIGYAEDPGYLLTQLKKFPRYSVLSEPDIRCVLIKKKIIDLLSCFSASYISFIYSFLDFAQRANYFGFCIVQSNHIFLSGSKNHIVDTINSFNDKKLFLEKYPYYSRIQKEFYLSYERHPLDNFLELFSKKNNKKKILLNYSIMPCLYCGTSEYQLSFAEAFYSLFSDKYDIYIYTNRPADIFHGLSKKYQNVLFPDTISGVFDLGFCAHQPFDIDDHFFMNRYCLKSVYSMLDIIMLRCDYVINEHKNLIIDDVVRLGFQVCDGIISISNYSTEDYKAYFIADSVIQNKPVKRVYIASNFGSSLNTKYDLPFTEYYLIAGNHYKHKGVNDTIRAVENSNQKFIAIQGMAHNGYIKDNIYAYKSGHISENFLGYLYANCKAVIFPSMYEGFGLPVAIALKNKKRIVLYNNTINNELFRHFKEFKDYFFFFDKFSQINEIIDAIDFSKELPSVEYNDTWDKTAIEIESFFDEIMNTEIDIDRLNERWHLFNFLESQLKELEKSGICLNPCKLIKNVIKKIIQKYFPGLYLYLMQIKYKITDSNNL